MEDIPSDELLIIPKIRSTGLPTPVRRMYDTEAGDVLQQMVVARKEIMRLKHKLDDSSPNIVFVRAAFRKLVRDEIISRAKAISPLSLTDEEWTTLGFSLTVTHLDIENNLRVLTGEFLPIVTDGLSDGYRISYCNPGRYDGTLVGYNIFDHLSGDRLSLLDDALGDTSNIASCALWFVEQSKLCVDIVYHGKNVPNLQLVWDKVASQWITPAVPYKLIDRHSGAHNG